MPGITVRGLDLRGDTRCRHWHSPLDIVAIRTMCCGEYYACADCHGALAGHPIAVWPPDRWASEAILCGACQTAMSIHAYMASGDRCPHCAAAFNPRCRSHYHLYFVVDGGSS